MQLSRFGVSMDEELVGHLDRLVERRGFANRSEALRAMVRRELVVPEEGPTSRDVAAVVSLVYPHGVTLRRHPIDPFPSLEISANLQLHLKGRVCLKVLVVQGIASEVRAWAEGPTTQTGVTASYQEVASEDIYSLLDHVPAGSLAGVEE